MLIVLALLIIANYKVLTKEREYIPATLDVRGSTTTMHSFPHPLPCHYGEVAHQNFDESSNCTKL